MYYAYSLAYKEKTAKAAAARRPPKEAVLAIAAPVGTEVEEAEPEAPVLDAVTVALVPRTVLLLPEEEELEPELEDPDDDPEDDPEDEPVATAKPEVTVLEPDPEPDDPEPEAADPEAVAVPVAEAEELTLALLALQVRS